MWRLLPLIIMIIIMVMLPFPVISSSNSSRENRKIVIDISGSNRKASSSHGSRPSVIILKGGTISSNLDALQCSIVIVSGIKIMYRKL